MDWIGGVGVERYNPLMRPAMDRQMTWQEYLEFEETCEVKHEFHDGYLYAMSGVKRIHAQLAARLHLFIGKHLEGRECEALFSDFVYVEAVNRALYPDVFVSCDGEASADDYFSTNAPLVIEVLSPSTEAYDRGDKFGHYRALPSLREYVLVDTKSVKVDLFRRLDEATWAIESAVDGDVVRFESIGLQLSVDALYEGLTLSEPHPG